MIALALTALLSFTDPQGDTNGDGSLQAPTAAVNRTIGSLDITKLELYDTETLSLGLQFASLNNPFNLTNGFSFPIIEIYLDNPETPGINTLLPGSEMTLPNGAFWDYAFKITGDAITVFEASPQGIKDITSFSAAKLSPNGDILTLQTSLPRPQDLNLYALAGNYSPFVKTGWMPTSSSSSPWAYSSETQTSPVVEVVASSIEKQTLAIQSGVLPAIEVQRYQVNPWFYMMFVGIAVALLGVIGRFFVKPAPVFSEAPEVWLEPETPVPSEFIAAERLKNQQINEDIQQEATRLSQEQETLGPSTTMLISDSQEDTDQETLESLTPSISPTVDEINDERSHIVASHNQAKKDDLFNVWVDDEVTEDVDWSVSKK